MSKKVLAKFTPPTKKKSSESEEPKKAKKSKKDKSSKKKTKSKDKVAAKKVKKDKPKKAKKDEESSSEVESAHLHIRIAPTLLETLQDAAKAEDRKYANLAKVILREGLKKRGYEVAA